MREEWMKNWFTIGEIIDKNTKKRCETLGYRIGRKCYIWNDGFQVEKSLLVNYEDDVYFFTTPIEDFYQDDYGVWVITKNREYRFDNI